ncbi:hypothetical protein AQUCO_00200212v1, partial [Aquilegia coerulea]
NIYTKRHVYVLNDLAPFIGMNIHCKSGDNDLGEKLLAYSETTSWSFKTNFFRTTLYWCNIDWVDENNRVFYKSFQVYNARKVEISGCKDCFWSAKKNGIYFNKGVEPTHILIYTWESY